jgi:hypothetical protein
MKSVGINAANINAKVNIPTMVFLSIVTPYLLAHILLP